MNRIYHNFMATVAGTRPIPEHLERTFARLLDDFQTLARNDQGRAR